MKLNDIVICKKNYESKRNGNFPYLKGKKYKIVEITNYETLLKKSHSYHPNKSTYTACVRIAFENDKGGFYFNIDPEIKKIGHIFKKVFYTTKEMRKLKLQKLNEKI